MVSRFERTRRTVRKKLSNWTGAKPFKYSDLRKMVEDTKLCDYVNPENRRAYVERQALLRGLTTYHGTAATICAPVAVGLFSCLAYNYTYHLDINNNNSVGDDLLLGVIAVPMVATIGALGYILRGATKAVKVADTAESLRGLNDEAKKPSSDYKGLTLEDLK